MQKNSLPHAMIETNDERSYINVFIPVHEGCGDKVILNGTQDGTQDKLDVWIEEQIRKNLHITTEELAKLSKKGIRTIKRRISKLPHIKYIGSGYSGHWEIEGNDSDQ